MSALKFSVCIEMLYRELEFIDRLPAVAAAGYPAVEFWGWKNKPMDAIKARADECGVQIAGFLVECDRVLLNPDTGDEWVAEARASVAEAARLGVGTLIVTTGQADPELSREVQHQAIVRHLKSLAPYAEDQGVTLVLEPLNILVNHQGYYLSTSDEGFEIVDEVGSPRIKLLFDIYHQQVTEGNLLDRIGARIGDIGHLHVADVPGRHEPGTGEINYANIFPRLLEMGYQGYVGLEFTATGTADEALAQVRQIAGLT
jgi:hydroxypyruvate isomerase